MLLTLLTKWKSCFWNLLHKCSKTNCYWGYWHCWHHIIQKNHIFPLVFCCCWQCWQQRNLVFEKCLKDVQRLTAVDTVDTDDITKFRKILSFSLVFCCWCLWHCWQHRYLVVEICFKYVQRLTAVDAVDNTQNLFL